MPSLTLGHSKATSERRTRATLWKIELALFFDEKNCQYFNNCIVCFIYSEVLFETETFATTRKA